MHWSVLLKQNTCLMVSTTLYKLWRHRLHAPLIINKIAIGVTNQNDSLRNGGLNINNEC